MIPTLNALWERMAALGVTQVLAKQLAPNDNSKNQVYLGGDFAVLNVLPHGKVYTDDAEVGGAVRDRAKAAIDLWWIGADYEVQAPNTGLILYPKYPEVRMSGFLSRCARPPSEIMASRDLGRVLVLGIVPSGRIYGYAINAEHPVAREIDAIEDKAMLGVFIEVPRPVGALDPKRSLLEKLREAHQLGWMPSVRLRRDGARIPYRGANGGGYTLEAHLGITPNGYAEPDFMGWEVKQFGVGDFLRNRAKNAVTLLTPEPSEGLYRTEGAEAFVRRFGYPDRKGVPDRLNFGGIHACDRDYHELTGLALRLRGYSVEDSKITDMAGGIELVDRDGVPAAVWPYSGLLEHWNRKHAKAAYVPSMSKSPPPEYAYGNHVELYVKTDFLLFLRQMADGVIYYDPGIKLEQASSAKPKLKRRSQFRVAHSSLSRLYEVSEIVVL